MSQRWDVVIVGAGPAGCAAGITLARQGLRVAVLDRARFPRDKTCGDALSNRAVALLEALGAGEHLASAPHAVVKGAVAILPDGARIPRDYGALPGRIVPRLALDDALRRTLERAGARVFEGENVRGLLREGDRVRGVRGASGPWEAPVVLAADGHGSVAWTHESRPRGRALAVSATSYLQGAEPLGDPSVSEHYFEADLPFGYGWIFPAVGGVCNVGVYLRNDGYARAGTALKTLLERFLERRLGRPPEAVRVWSLPLASEPRPRDPDGLFSCGDAGRFIDPLTGEGIFQALRSGELAAEAAGAVLSGRSLRAEGLRYRLRCARELGLPSMARGALQDGLQRLLDTGLYRSPMVRRALAWGYGGGALEVTKTVARR
ncbi:MAG: geranylgeranyl reductase family protein [Deltaproteobacteria bacterium]|nr:geranylgeranyl reductase family protein [Deltaproteobacteria bacterium]